MMKGRRRETDFCGEEMVFGENQTCQWIKETSERKSEEN